jgi:hypothetical protein
VPALPATNLPDIDRLKVRRVSDAASWSPNLLQAMAIGRPFGSEIDFEVSLQEQLRALIDGLARRGRGDRQSLRAARRGLRPRGGRNRDPGGI